MRFRLAWLAFLVAIVLAACGCSEQSSGPLVGANVPIPSPGDAGYVLTSQGKGATPAWQPPADGGALAPGTAGQALYTNDAGAATIWVTNSGDFTCSTSTPGNCTVDGLQTKAVSTTAPSVGNSLIWDGGTWGPSAVNLAGGSNSVTGNLPAASVAPGTSPQVLMTTTGPATAWETVSQDVTLGATGAATVNSIHGTAPVNVTNSALSFGSTVAGIGDLRFPNNSTIITARNAANTGDLTVLTVDSSNNVNLTASGTGAGSLLLDGPGAVELAWSTGVSLYLGNTGTTTTVQSLVSSSGTIKHTVASTDVLKQGLASSDLLYLGPSGSEAQYLPTGITFQASVTTPTWQQTAQASTSSGSGAAGQATTVSSQPGQAATGAANNGGNGGPLYLLSGAGGTSGSATAGIPGAVVVGLGSTSHAFAPTGSYSLFEVVDPNAVQMMVGTAAAISGGNAGFTNLWLGTGNVGWTPSTSNYLFGYASAISALVVNEPLAAGVVYIDIAGNAVLAITSTSAAPVSAGGIGLGTSSHPFGDSDFGYNASYGYLSASGGVLQPSTNGLYSFGGSSNRWGDTWIGGGVTGGISVVAYEFASGYAQNTTDVQQGLGRHILVTYTQAAVGPVTAASGTSGSVFCPGSTTMAGVHVYWTARTHTGANYAYGESVNACFNNGGTAGCGTNATAFTTVVSGTVCPSGSPTAVIATGSSGCFVVNTTCPGWTSGNIDFQLDVYANND